MEIPDRFQAVLYGDGRIAFHYGFIAAGDGIVGVFSNAEPTRGALIASIVDGRDPELPGYLDLLEAAIYATDTDAVILEFTTRDPIPTPGSDTWYSYRLYFDTDAPYWTDFNLSDLAFVWQVDLGADGEYRPRVGRVLESDAANRIALLVDITDVSGISASAIAGTAEFHGNTFVGGESSRPARISLPEAAPTTDLSRSDGRVSRRQNEVFHYRGVPDLEKIACRVIEVLGDRFDVIVFHGEFRLDSQEDASPWTGYEHGAKGIGVEARRPSPCSDRLMGHYARPVWMPVVNETNFDDQLVLFAHEFGHSWMAYLSYEKDGKPEPLYGDYCACHWRLDLHAPAAFPWHADAAGPISIMGGRFWRENGDGTYTAIFAYHGGGFSWLDLYVMGLADAGEVPEMFLLPNLKGINEVDARGTHAGEKEIVSIRQVVAVHGPRTPGVGSSQKDFKAGFAYLVAPGQAPSADLLDRHAKLVDKVQEHWFHITGGRSRITALTAR